MRTLFVFLLSLLILLSCKSQPAQNFEQYQNLCKNIKAECSLNCVEKTFHVCFVDTKLFPNEPYDVFNNCHAVHVGNLCEPCEQLFSVNFGGAMRASSCEEFLEAIDRKNKDKACNGCLKKLGDAPFSYFRK